MPSDPQFQVSESGQDWRSVPRWMEWLIDFGYDWPTDLERPRRICLLSLPCDSAAAGLVTLGAMIRGLCLPQANELDLHFDFLLQHGKQHLDHCKPCDLPHCDPQVKGCGYSSKANGRIKLTTNPHCVYTISEVNCGERRLKFVRNNITWDVGAGRAPELHLHGMPEIELGNSLGQLPPPPYRHAVADAKTKLVPENLQQTFSGLCFAGRVGGSNAARKSMASLRFKDEFAEYGLDELLSVHEWSVIDVSRVSYFNSRTNDIDRMLAPPNLLVADGDMAFLKALDRQEFRSTDIIGVIHRAMERDALEQVGNKLEQLRQWYEVDKEMTDLRPVTVPGISATILKKR